MKINDKVQRTNMFGKVDNFTIHDPANLKYHQDLMKVGYGYVVLEDGEWVPVPRELVEQKPMPNVCIACE